MAQPAGAGATMLIFISSGSSEYRTMGSCVLCVPAICRLTPTSRPGVSSSCSSVVSTAQQQRVNDTKQRGERGGSEAARAGARRSVGGGLAARALATHLHRIVHRHPQVRDRKVAVIHHAVCDVAVMLFDETRTPATFVCKRQIERSRKSYSCSPRPHPCLDRPRMWSRRLGGRA